MILEVGEEQKRFLVHKDLLIHESMYFKAMFAGQWSEASATEPLRLQQADHRIFPIFLDWLYFRRFPPSTETGGPCNACGKDNCKKVSTSTTDYLDIDTLTDEEDAYFEALINRIDRERWATPLYIFADKFDFPNLREELVTRRWRTHVKHGFRLGYWVAINAFRELPASSPLSRFVIDAYIDGWMADGSMKQICEMQAKLRAKLPMAFVFKLAAKLAKRSQVKSPKKAVGPLCAYHEHAQDAVTIAACMAKASKSSRAVRADHADLKKLEDEHLTEDQPVTMPFGLFD